MLLAFETYSSCIFIARINKARDDRDTFERQLRAQTEKLSKSIERRKALKELVEVERRKYSKLQTDSNHQIARLNSEIELKTDAIKEIRHGNSLS